MIVAEMIWEEKVSGIEPWLVTVSVMGADRDGG